MTLLVVNNWDLMVSPVTSKIEAHYYFFSVIINGMICIEFSGLLCFVTKQSGVTLHSMEFLFHSSSCTF